MMKFLMVFLAVVLGASIAFGVKSPVQPWVEKIEPSDLKAFDNDGTHLNRTIRVTYDFDVHGGSTASAIDLGRDLPKNALVEKVFGYVEETAMSAQNGDLGTTLALECEDDKNLIHAREISGSVSGTFVVADVGGSASSMIGAISDNCDISVELGTADTVTGKIIFFIKYFIED